MTREAPTSFDITPEEKKKIKYPKSVFFIVSNEFCERFCFYGMRTVLALYLHQYLRYSEDDATIVYHAFVSFAYFTPLLGAMLADSLLGRFKTIVILSIIYAIGSITLSLSAMPNILPAEAFTYVGLLLIGLGTGGIKPCVSAFGGDQFIVPQQERQLQQFFSVFYFSVNGGSLLSTFITPILREGVQCFGEENCYSLAFGVPAILMVVSIVIFIAGKPMYKIKKPEGNVVLTVSKCIGHAVSQKMKSSGPKREHWLDYAEEEYGKKLVEDVKSSLRVLYLFIPLPMFWALFDQQGSRWTFQATRMDGDFGSFTIFPDQIQVFNPALVMVLIPLFEAVIYPLFKRLNILQKPVLKIAFGGILAGLAFIVSTLVELSIKSTEAVIPVFGEAQLRVVNTFNCPMLISLSGGQDLNVNEQQIEELDIWYNLHLKAQANNDFKITVKAGDSCGLSYPQISRDLSFKEKESSTFMIYDSASGLEVSSQPILEDPKKTNSGNPKFRIVYDVQSADKILTLEKKRGNKLENFALNQTNSQTQAKEIDFGAYVVKVGEVIVEDEIYPAMGGVYSYVVKETEPNKFVGSMRVITEANSINILWQIPQYVIITSGEVMFSITGLEFAFTQAPLAMKSVVTAGWLMVVAFGNIIVIIIAEAKFFEDPMWEFLLFAGLMFIFMFIFYLMSLSYKMVVVASEDSVNTNADKKEKESHENGGFEDR